MFNLLPDEDKKKVLNEYSLRRIAITLLFLFVSGLIALIAIFPSKLLSESKSRSIEKEVSFSKTSETLVEETALSARVSEIKSKLIALKGDELTTKVNLIDRIVNKRDSRIQIISFTYNSGDDKSSGSIVLYGVAQDREALLNFLKNLKTEELFKDANLPVSNFTKERNLDFTIEIKGKF
ncbi:MAG TPA: hypothetical protein VJC12_03350 [Candidatus Paceibacterota bacterium]